MTSDRTVQPVELVAVEQNARGDSAARRVAAEGRADQRRARYVRVSGLRVDEQGQARARMRFPRLTSQAAARRDAARRIAPLYGVEAAPAPSGAPSEETGAPVLMVSGPAPAVARYLSAVPRWLAAVEARVADADRVYGRWERHSVARAHLARIHRADRRAVRAGYRAAAYRIVVDTLLDPPAHVPEADDARPPWAQVERIAAGIALYYAVDPAEQADEAEARAILAAAERTAEPIEQPPVLFPLTALEPARERPAPAAAPRGTRPAPATAVGPLVIIPCSAAKLGYRAPAEQLYTGPLHRAARAAADAYTGRGPVLDAPETAPSLTATGGRILILSGTRRLYTLDEEVTPYDEIMPARLTPADVEQLRDEAARHGAAEADRVILLTPSRYTTAARTIWPHAVPVLEGCIGIGHMRSRLAHIARTGQLPPSLCTETTASPVN